MPTVRVKMGRYPALLTFPGTYKPGDMPPEGYIEWHEWADVQRKAGLRQAQCGSCSLWRFPQELSETRRESTVYRDKAMTKPVTVYGRICLKCEAKYGKSASQ